MNRPHAAGEVPMDNETIERYEQMLEKDPHSRAFAPLAEAHRKAGNLDEAIRVARAGLVYHPGYSGGLVVLGRSLYEKGELDKANDVLQQAVNDTPESYLGQKFLGRVLIDKGENRKALKALEAANLISPEDEEVVELIEEIRNKAEPPPTMEFSENDKVSEKDAQIVTYEQKPTTIDGVELPPLPPKELRDKFSFTSEDAGDPAQLPPAAVEREFLPPEAEGGDIIPVDAEEVEAASTEVIQEKDSGQAGAHDSLEDLGPEVASFIQEGEDLEEDLLEVRADAGSDPLVDVRDEEISTSGIPVPEAGREDRFSTETLADLYAQQGLFEKAGDIYREILEQTPDNEVVRSKLEALGLQSKPNGSVNKQESLTSELLRTGPQPGTDSGDTLRTLETMLVNVERIKRS